MGHIMITRLGVPGLLGMTLGLGLAVLSRTDTPAAAFDPEGIRCYVPAVTPAKLDVHKPAPDVAALRATVAPLTQDALRSARACAGPVCSSAQSASLKRTIFRYLETRRRITSDLYQQHRVDGLAIADQVFDNTQTRELSLALAGLQAQGRLDPAKFGADREALALVITKPAQAFRPCTASQTYRDVHWYVY